MIPFGALVLAPAMAAFAQPLMLTPAKSQPGAPAYPARGSYSIKPVEIPDEQGAGWHQSHRHALGIRLSEFAVPPRQGDTFVRSSGVPFCAGLLPDGTFEVTNVELDGQGGADLTLRLLP